MSRLKRVSSKSVRQKCQIRVSKKSVLPERFAIVSSKGFLQECHLSVSSQGVPQVVSLQNVTNKHFLCYLTYVSAFGFVGFILFSFIFSIIVMLFPFFGGGAVVAQGHLECARFLVMKGSSPELKTSQGQTALELCTQAGHQGPSTAPWAVHCTRSCEKSWWGKPRLPRKRAVWVKVTSWDLAFL